MIDDAIEVFNYLHGALPGEPVGGTVECHDGNRGSHSRSLATSAGSGARVPCPLTRRELLRLPPNLRA